MKKLNEFFKLYEEDILDFNKIKIIEGIAGSAKSSNIIKFFKNKKLPCIMLTFSHKLKRSAEKRYGIKCYTVASYLFYTKNGKFYAEEKEIDAGQTVIIDEVLLCDTRVFKWCEHNIGRINIIMLTDEQQMLSPGGEYTSLEIFREFKKRPDVIVTELTKSYRPVNQKTADYYVKCYQSVKENKSLYYEDKNKFRNISFEQFCKEYNYKKDVIIYHTNAEEKKTWNILKIDQNYDQEIIPKGTAAANPPKDITTLPLVCQTDAEGVQMAYGQPANQGTPTRFQGSEILDGQKAYFTFEPGSRVEAREWYTDVTRCKNIDSITIVNMTVDDVKPLKVYNRRRVKKTAIKNLPDVQLKDGRKLSEIKADENKIIKLSKDEIELLSLYAADDEDYYYEKDKFFFRGRFITIEDKEMTEEEKQKAEEEQEETKNKKTKVSMRSMLAKEPCFKYEYMPDFYRSLEKAETSRPAGTVEEDMLKSPLISNIAMDFMACGKDYKIKNRHEYKYGLDLCAAFPTILNFEKLPTNRAFYPRSANYKDNFEKINIKESPDRVDWFAFFGSRMLPWGSIVTGELARFIQANDKIGIENCVYIGSSDAQVGSKMGERLYNMAFDTVESNEERKECHYGYAARQYIQPIYTNSRVEAEKAYTVNEENLHQLLDLVIKNYETLVILKIKKCIYGDILQGFTNCDALYFDYEGDIQELGKKIEEVLPNYKFRIFLNSKEDKKANILYQNYEPLKTKAEKKKEYAREYARTNSEKKKEYLKEYRRKKKAEGVL